MYSSSRNLDQESHEPSVLEPAENRMSRRRVLRKLHRGARIVFHRSILNEVPLFVCFVVSAIWALYLTIRIPASVIFIDLSNSHFPELILPFPTFFTIPLVVLGFLVHRLFDDRFIITEDHIVSVNGLLSLRVLTNRIHFAHVRGIEVERNLYQRVVGTGNIRVGSAAHSDLEIEMIGVGKPDYYRNVIEALTKVKIDKLIDSKSIEGVYD
ncbi:MAG: PH domain-containing protein [Bdellovibrionales bacterium]|nr:PH domain-containing protein [Bdellovibrionales bacterium]